MLHIQVVNYGHIMRQAVLFWYSINNCEHFKIMKCAIIIPRGCIKRLKKKLLNLFFITLDLILNIFMFKNLTRRLSSEVYEAGISKPSFASRIWSF